MATNVFDNEPSADWKRRYKDLLQQSAADFRACPNDELVQLQACARYFNRGYAGDFDHGELIDYLGVSAHSVLDLAGYTDDQAIRVMELLPLLADNDGVFIAPLVMPPITPPHRA